MEYSVSPCLTLWWTTAFDAVSGADAWCDIVDLAAVILAEEVLSADALQIDALCFDALCFNDPGVDDFDDVRFDATLVSLVSLAPGLPGRWTNNVFLPARLSPFRRFQLRIILAETPKFSATDSTVSPLRIL